MIDAPPEHTYPPLLTPMSDADALTTAIHRLATALEQHTLAILDARLPEPVRAPQLAPLPPVAAATPQPTAAFDGCPIHHVPWKVVPAGVSKKTGRPYETFRACTVSGCDQRPPR